MHAVLEVLLVLETCVDDDCACLCLLAAHRVRRAKRRTSLALLDLTFVSMNRALLLLMMMMK